MSGLKTLIRAALCLSLVSQALPAFANDAPTLPDAEWFAVCTGRLSALMEHQFLTDGAASEATKGRRDAMADLLDAVAGPDEVKRLMGLRVDAKWAFRALLTQATFGPDPDRHAARQAKRLGQSCTALLLG